MTFLSPSWRSLNLWKGHLTIPKRSQRITRNSLLSSLFFFAPGFSKHFMHQASANFGSIWTFCAEMRERVKGTLNSLAIVLPSPGPDNMTSNPPRCRFGGRKICQAGISRLISSNLSPNPYSIQYLFQQFQHPQFQGKKISLWANPHLRSTHVQQ